MIGRSIEKEYAGMVDAYEKAGGDRDTLLKPDVARLVIHENKVLGSEGVSGLKIDTKEIETGVSINLVVEKGTKIEKPVHLCFGVLSHGKQCFSGESPGDGCLAEFTAVRRARLF